MDRVEHSSIFAPVSAKRRTNMAFMSFTSRKKAPIFKLPFLLIFLIASCLLSVATTHATAPATAGFSLSPSVTSFTLLDGGSSASSTINVVDQNGFSGSVNFSVSGVPGGVNASFNSPSSPWKSTLTFTPTGAAVPGNYTVTVTGTSGNLTSTAAISVNIPVPSFTLSASAKALTILVGGSSGSSVISVVNPVGLSNGNVNLAVSGGPAGVTTQLNWPVASATSPITLTVTASASAVAGTYPITIRGTSGTTASTTTIVVTIPAPSFSLTSSASSITLTVGQNGWNLPIDISVTNTVGLANKPVLTVSGLPGGVTSSFTTVNASTLALTFNVSVSAVAGTYPLKVSGTSGIATSSTTVVLTIPQPSFSLSPTVNSFKILPGGGSASSLINIVDQNGFTGSVSFAVSGVPSGVNATFSYPSSLWKSTLTITPTSAAVPGNYTLNVIGTSGTITSTASIALAIPAPSFSISSSPSTVNLVLGTTASSAIDIMGLNGSGSSVALTVTGLPTGVTAGFSPAVTSNTSSVTFAASSAAVPGTYPLTIVGTSGSVSTATIQLTIPAPVLSISAAIGSLTALPGGSGASTTINISGVSGSSAAVALTATGVPSNVSAQFSSAAGSSVRTLTLLAGISAAPGTYTVAVTGVEGTQTSTTNVSLTIPGPLSIAITQPEFGFNVIPGSVRRIYATVSNGKTNGVNWTVTGGAKLSAAVGNWVDVTAPATGTSCSIQGTENYTVSSATRFTLTAQSQESPSQTASITVNVCNPAVQVTVVPFYTTLYSGQNADVQAFVWGSVNHDVTWAITAEPNGADGVLMDSVNQDTVFSATVAGRYTLTATSVADGSKTNAATIYVTGHSMPYDVTPSETMPVDCTVDPALTGKTYDVGPSQAYKTIQSVPWASLTAGSTVRIHNEDASGGSPTTYHEYFLLTGQGTRTQPIRVCGVPDSRGNLPVIDASNATGSSSFPANLVGYGAVTVGKGGWAGVYTGTWTGPQDLIVEGLKVQNARPPATLTSPSGVAGTAWAHGAACVRLFQNVDTVVRGIDANGCSNGIFSDFNANNGYAVVANTLYEGNHVHGNGEAGSYSYHQLYIQGWNEVAQFNIVDQYLSGAAGSNFKGRGFPEIIRYNHFGDGAARELDLVDNQDAATYSAFEGYLGGPHPLPSVYPKDAYTADLLAAAVEAHHADYVYGNTFVNTTAVYPIHYFSDMGTPDDNRLGTLWFYNNSFYEPINSFWSWKMFDTSGGGAGDDAAIEWPHIQVLNNAIWMDSQARPYFYWNKETNQFTTFGKNVINSSWGTDNMAGGDGTGWATLTSKFAFQGAGNSADATDTSSLIGVTTEPFDTTTFEPNPALVGVGTTMPVGAPKLPVRFQYGPSAVQTVRVQPLTVGAME